MNFKNMKSKKSKGNSHSGTKGTEHELSNTLSEEYLKSEIFNPEDFLSVNPKTSILSLDLLEKIYNLTKSLENNGSLEDPLGLKTKSLKSSKPLSKKKTKKSAVSKAEAPVSKLITKNFDEGQIWEEVEIQNKFMHDNLVTSVSKLLAYQEKSLEVEDSDSDVESVSDGDGGSQLSHSNSNDRENLEGEEEEQEEDSDFFESDNKHSTRSPLKQYPKSVVDDKFFSLAQMTEHIERIEAEENKNKHEDENSSDEDSIDLFEDTPSEDEQNKEAPEYYYKDFFDPPMQNVSNQSKEKDHKSLKSKDSGDSEGLQKKSVSFDLNEGEIEHEDFGQDSDGDEQDLENLDENEDDDDQRNNGDELQSKIKETLSTFEKRKQRIEENIEEIENEALQPKSWHLLGEATAENRPENALLEEHLIYDHLIRPAPAITAETTMKLEDVIKQRIKDSAWDDVQRKVRPVEDAREYKKRLVLDAEKSKASLSDIYEKEYLEQKRLQDGETEEKEPEEHVQIRNDLKSLFQKLDSLSHFHFTPKQPPPEVRIISNAPSISIEETAGVSVSDANMLAPQEIEDHTKGLIKGKDERTITDRNRERRKKKKKQHLNRLMQEEKARAKGLGLRNVKLAEGIVKSQQKSSAHMEGYSTSQQSTKELKSSKAFFAKLQQNATSHIDKVAKRKRISGSNESNDKKSAKKYKL